MRISDYKNEDALDLLADLLDPVSVMFSDTELVKMLRGNAPKIQGIKYVLKHFPTQIIEILARLEGVPVEEYSTDIVKMTTSLLDIANDKELMGFFTSSAQTMGVISSGAVTETTKEQKM